MKKKILFVVVPLFIVVLTGIYLLNGCQKDVGVITNIVKYDITGYVLSSETFTGIDGVKVSLDGKLVATTDATGKYVLTSLKPGSYLIVAQKTDYSQGLYNITVSNDGMIAKSMVLKKLAPSVTVGATGGSATATNTSGSIVAKLTIPAGELSTNKQVSVTNLKGNETPKLLENKNKLLGTTVTLHSDDPNISFTNGATLTFKLPFKQKPGDLVEVDYFNETNNTWEIFQNAVVKEDGLTANVTIHHFSTYSAVVNGNYTEEVDHNIGAKIIATSDDYQQKYEWESSLEYRNSVTDSIDHEWLYSTVEGQTKINFSSITYNNSQIPVSKIINKQSINSTGNINKLGNNITTVTRPPLENPEGYRKLPKRHWELMQLYCTIYEGVTTYRWVGINVGYINDRIPNWYKVYTYIWIWRPNDTFVLPNLCYLLPPTTIIIVTSHSGGTVD